MASQAAAIVGVRPSGANATLGLPAWLRGIGVRQVRIACGLVMFSYIFSHFFVTAQVRIGRSRGPQGG
jgi:hypothetical protein